MNILAPLVLIALLILVPIPSQVVQNNATPSSISALSHSYAILPLPPNAGENTLSIRISKTDSSKKAGGHGFLVSFHTWNLLAEHDPVIRYAGGFNSVVKAGSQQACLLLDLPPPARG